VNERAERLAAYDRRRAVSGLSLLAGVDEAGRGCWAGPVVAAAVILPAGIMVPGLDDSKRLSAIRREGLFAAIAATAVCWRACAVAAAEIDRTHILAATLQAMTRSIARLSVAPDLVLVDGNQAPLSDHPVETLVRGDGTSSVVAAASIVAKVLRDRVMVAWDRRYPGYGFAAHKGYGVAAHRRALRELGPCPLHRRTFKPVADATLLQLWNEKR
jgi:ribonuclease HII